MKKSLTAFFMAWGMFCAIPCPYKKWDETLYPRMLLCLPLVGLLLGCIWALCAWLIGLAGGRGLFGAAILTVVLYLLTGFIHLDGYMDCADAILSRRNLEQRRRILKDSHVGSFAVICVCILMLLVFSLFATGDLNGRRLCLIFIPAVSRASAAMAVLGFRPMEGSSYVRMFGSGVKSGHKIAAAAMTVVFAALPIIFCGLPGLSGAAGAVGSWIAILYGRKNLGGMSGDIAGCGITVGELCAVAALILI